MARPLTLRRTNCRLSVSGLLSSGMAKTHVRASLRLCGAGKAKRASHEHPRCRPRAGRAGPTRRRAAPAPALKQAQCPVSYMQSGGYCMPMTRMPAAIGRLLHAVPCGERRAPMASCSSSALRSLSPASRSIWSSDAGCPPRRGKPQRGPLVRSRRFPPLPARLELCLRCYQSYHFDCGAQAPGHAGEVQRPEPAQLLGAAAVLVYGADAPITAI
jgi:hypothetical protein